MARKVNLAMVIVAIMTVLVGASSARADLTDGLVAHWEFNEGVGIDVNDSAGSNHGVIHGASWTTGKFGGALSFDGINKSTLKR